MPSTYDVTDPKTGTIFRYSSVSYWDKEKKKPRSKNEYLGKVDPVTGELIPKKARKKKAETQEEVQNTTALTATAVQDDQEERIRILEARVAELEKERCTERKASGSC